MKWCSRTRVSLYLIVYWKLKVVELIYEVGSIVVIERQGGVMQGMLCHGSSSLQ
jgi:hypothetical protein